MYEPIATPAPHEYPLVDAPVYARAVCVGTCITVKLSELNSAPLGTDPPEWNAAT